MPLKHRTETRLVVILGLVIVVTGFVLAALPDMPVGLIPWAVAFIAAVLYPVLLYPLFRRDRADYTFRMLHWVPAAMLLLWMILQLLSVFVPVLGRPLAWYTWGWGFGAVALAMLALVNFCLDVVRQRVPRIPALLILWVAFAFSALRIDAATPTKEWLASLADGGFNPGIIAGIGNSNASSSAAAEAESTSSVIPTSADPAEEAWRSALRSVDNRSSEASSSVMASEQSEASESSSSEQSSSRPAIGSVSSDPTELPNSGFGWSAVVLTLIGGYCAAMHRRLRFYI